MTESQATTKLLNQLRDYGYFWKASDKFRAGVPDIVGVYAGRFMAIEMKIDYNSPTPLQIHELMEIIKNEGYGAVVTYNNKNKKWWVKDQSFASPRLTALHLIERSRFHKDDIQN
jgi:Holliday junction resolvase